MAGMHTVAEGESLSAIASRNGLQSWRTIWDHPRNVELRSHRPTPELVHQGDQVYVPDRQARIAPATTTTTNRFVAQVTRTDVMIRSITILVHGVNTDAEWFSLVAFEMRKFQNTICVPADHGNVEQRLRSLIIPFTWGDYAIRKQGGHPNYAVDEVHQMFENPRYGLDRIYQGHAAVRLKLLIDECKKLNVQVNVIAHSNGTLETCGALLLGTSIDNFILMGSPLDCDNSRSQNELHAATAKVRGKTINFWSSWDEWATQKGGIGANGNNAAYLRRNGHINNVHFVNGSTIRGVTINEKINHSDYMVARNMPIFSSYIREFERSAPPPVLHVRGNFLKLIHMGDWTDVSYYVQGRNVTLNSPEMRPYAGQISALPR